MRSFVFLVLVMLVVDAQPSSLSDMYGSLHSPNFPEPYPRETQLRWNISVPDGFQIKLYFSHFDLEPSYLCEYDFVKVEAESEVLGLFCGRDETDTEAVPGQQVVTSPRHSLSVVFSSDFSNEERNSGFMAHYRAEDVDECSDRGDEDEDLICDHFCHNFIGGYYCSCRYGYLLHTDNRTCRVECSDGVFRERSGVLSSVDFPAPYPKSSECSYRIEVETGFRLRLQFEPDFDVEDHPDVRCPYDYVKITAGSSEFGPFCGSRSPGIIQTDSNIVTVDFHSDNSGDNLGWKMTYTSTGSQCPVPETPPNAVMNPVQSEYSFKDHILFTCEPGYRLMKDGDSLDQLQLDCGSDGSWSSRLPQCQMVDCGSPQAVHMADVVFGNHDNSTLFGSTVRYVCRGDAFDLNASNNSYSCGPEGRWTSAESGLRLPSCSQACGRPSRALPPQVKRIVGGRSAEPGLFPWHVLLSVEDLTRVPEDRWFGSGALLSESWVLTAAHVLRAQRRDASIVAVAPEHVKVFLGLHDARDKRLSTRRSVETIVLHPNFQPDNYNNDIALLKLTERVEFNSVIRPVCLPPPDDQDDPSSPVPNSLGVVAGWGITVPNVSSSTPGDPPSLTSDLLQYVKLPVVPQDECQASYTSRSVSYNITDNMFCAGFFEGGRDTCLGDSGGAFVMEDEVSRGWVVFGLVSWGGPEECGSQRVYGVYTRVAKYVEWLQHHLQAAAPWW
ncbi:putative mannan-binding lectin serine protease 1 [Scophthalmus maximus]|uniref:Putative mannan-binding lectin serine protease 1 n=1 Tax=Scophthalmus maximus TaxID=52904 RepID=A0A2U9B6L9_SCOMX|nr:putative mannan-binding lectin serine protease 1 [Scophthalmus maximus]